MSDNTASPLSLAPPNLKSLFLTGALSFLLILALSFGLIKAAGTELFMGWISFVFMAGIPMQVIIGLLWGHQFPNKIAALSQPMRGIAFTVIMTAIAIIIAGLINYIIGDGAGPNPMVMQYTILTIVIALWIVPIWQCWPFSMLSKSPVVVGILTLVGIYLIAFALWHVFFNYDVMASASFYNAALAPSGLFEFWPALVFAVTTGAVIILHVPLDFWPLSKIAGKGQPIYGFLSGIYVLAISAFVQWFTVSVCGMDVVDFMVQVPVSLLFGVFLTCNLVQFGLFPNMKQPLKGFYILALTIIAAVLIYRVYEMASVIINGQALPSGPDGHWTKQIWIASAMLSVTFPIVLIVSGFFDFWPFKRTAKSAPVELEPDV